MADRARDDRRERAERVEQPPRRTHDARPHVPARSVRRVAGDQGGVAARADPLLRDRLRILTSLVQPFLFLFVLGTGLSTLVSSSTHGVTSARSSTPACCAWR